MAESFDYVIVGAGSAGCVLAGRLSEGGEASVCLLEAGPPDGAWTIRMPAAVSINIKGTRYNWRFASEPEALLGGRRIVHPRGRVLGGSSSLNGMIFVRGHAYDYDRWAREGAVGWSYADVLPYFRRLESYAQGANRYRGGEGPVYVQRSQVSNPLHEAFLTAGQQAGYPLSEDLNGYQQFGVGLYDKNIRAGKRVSAADAYLASAGRGQRLTVITGALADRVRIENGRACAIEIIREGRRRVIRAEREVILSAGAFGSPTILMRSGVGNPDSLRRLGIEPLCALPGVGRNLQDHLELHIQYACREPITLYGDLQPLSRAMIAARWFLTRTGKGATNHYDTGAFLLTEPGAIHPDVQFHFVPIVYNNAVERRVDSHGYRVHAGPLRSAARGEIALRSADPTAPPVIRPNYLSAERDRFEMRRVVELSREILSAPAFARYRGPEISPGAAARSAADIDAFIYGTADTGYHPASTCAMGVGPAAVVDSLGRVHGLAGLRVVDASIMPSIVSGNLHAPVMMMAEKLADAIAGRPPLTVDPAPVYEARAANATAARPI